MHVHMCVCITHTHTHTLNPQVVSQKLISWINKETLLKDKGKLSQHRTKRQNQKQKQKSLKYPEKVKTSCVEIFLAPSQIIILPVGSYVTTTVHTCLLSSVHA